MNTYTWENTEYNKQQMQWSVAKSNWKLMWMKIDAKTFIPETA